MRADVIASLLANSAKRARIEERFWIKVKRRGSDDCWEWTLKPHRHTGYGTFFVTRVGDRLFSEGAHRVAWMLAHGQPPPYSIVCHSCDNRLCCNPQHLFLGSHDDNMRDMRRKGRSLRGEKNVSAKLTEAQVQAILSSNKTHRELAEAFGVARRTISHIKRGTSWNHVAGLKGRAKFGGKKLTVADVREIKRSDETSRILAERFGVHYQSVWAIRSGLSWRHVEP